MKRQSGWGVSKLPEGHHHFNNALKWWQIFSNKPSQYKVPFTGKSSVGPYAVPLCCGSYII